MAENTQGSAQADYHQYERVYLKTAPDLEPYPAGQQKAPLPRTQNVLPVQPPETSLPPYQPPQFPVPRPEPQLPGAIQNPCCMGSDAMARLEVLTGFLEEELLDQRYYRAMSRQAPAWAREKLRELGESAGAHAKELQSVYYMITGQCYRSSGTCGEIYIGSWCPALRERYHTEACEGLNYARAAEDTSDPCLREILNRLSREEYQHARVLLELLQKSMRH